MSAALITKADIDGVPNSDIKAKKASIGGGYTFAPGMSSVVQSLASISIPETLAERTKPQLSLLLEQISRSKTL